MQLTCPNCETPIFAEDINISANIAKCNDCGEIHKADELMESISSPDDFLPPKGSQVTFEAYSDNRGVFSIPKTGFKPVYIYPIGFATFWVGFIAFWTIGAAFGSIIFAAFSIPFWLVGFAMWRGIIKGITESQQIEIERTEIIITKKSKFSTKATAIAFKDIDSIDIDDTPPGSPTEAFGQIQSAHKGNLKPFMPTIFHGVKKTRFAENLSEPEKKWMVKILKAITATKIGNR